MPIEGREARGPQDFVRQKLSGAAAVHGRSRQTRISILSSDYDQHDTEPKILNRPNLRVSRTPHVRIGCRRGFRIRSDTLTPRLGACVLELSRSGNCFLSRLSKPSWSRTEQRVSFNFVQGGL